MAGAWEAAREGLVRVLQELYGRVAALEDSVASEWTYHKPLLEQKKWTTEEQIKILEAEVRTLHDKLKTVDKRCAERQALVTKTFRAALVPFYEEHNRDKLGQVDGILAHFRGREHEILSRILERYNVEVDPTTLKKRGMRTTEDEEDVLLGDLQRKKEQLWNEIAHVEDAVVRSKEELEKVKRDLYFPRVQGWRFKHGADGVYVAMNDFWIEQISMRISLSVLDRVKEPRILVVASGSQTREMPSRTSTWADGGSNSGAKKRAVKGGVVAFRVDKCGLHGEKGTKVPSLRPEQLRLLVEFQLTVPIEFSSGAWRASKGFHFKIMRIERQLKGSLYVPRSLLRLVLNRVLPGLIRGAILQSIPVELGAYLQQDFDNPSQDPGQRHSREPMHLNLDINLDSPFGDSTVLDTKLNMPGVAQGQGAEAMRYLFGLTDGQAETFVSFQHAVHQVHSQQQQQQQSGTGVPWPGPLVTASDLVQFFLRYSDESFTALECDARQDGEAGMMHAVWHSIVSTMQQAVDLFADFHNVESVKIATLFQRVHALSLKPVHQHVQLSSMRLRVSTDWVLVMVRDVLKRTVQERHRESAKRRVHLTKPLDRHLAEIDEWYNDVADPVTYLKQGVHHVDAHVTGKGNGGNFDFGARDILFHGPVRLQIPFVDALYPPTHFAIKTTVSPPSSGGDYGIDLLLSPFIDPEERLKSAVVQLSLRRAFAGFHFDIKNYLLEQILEFKNFELERLLGADQDDVIAGAKALSRKRSSSVPAARRPERHPAFPVGGRLVPLPLVVKASDTELDSLPCPSSPHLEDEEEDEGEQDLDAQDDTLSPTFQDSVSFQARSRKLSDVTLTSETGVEADDDAGSTNSSYSDGSGSGAQDGEDDNEKLLREFLRREKEHVSDDGDDDDDHVPEQDPEQVIRAFARKYSTTEAPPPAARAEKLEWEEDNHPPLPSQSPAPEDPHKRYAAQLGPDTKEASVDRFLLHLLNKMDSRKNASSRLDDNLKILNATFHCDASAREKEDMEKGRFLFRVETDPLTVMKAGAQHFGLRGHVADVCYYVYAWIKYHAARREAAAAAVGQQPQRDNELHALLQSCVGLLAKYVDKADSLFQFDLQLEGGTVSEQLVAAVCTSAEPATFEGSFRVLDLVADVRTLAQGADPATSDLHRRNRIW
ncbi:Hypothetical protein SCF082_LOCUS51206 [Durusdinium trenchii]|uniref:Uncharacterized protein n=1 Tax=Durusdinium trenchii TaxID=1381693 RepID=A0ABP0SCV9_9DINO